MYWRINIDGRVYEGNYKSKPDAVFGAMLKDSYRVQDYAERYSEGLEPSLIGIERIEKSKAKKIHRVYD